MAGVQGLGCGFHSPLVMACLPHFLHTVKLYHFGISLSSLKAHFQQVHNKNITNVIPYHNAFSLYSPKEINGVCGYGM
jgi:hypothetical protein